MGSQNATGQVKPLAWGDATSPLINTGIYFSRSVTPFGSYRTERSDAGKWRMISPNGEALRGANGLVEHFATLDEAKAAAQADYQRSVLSALVSEPAAAPNGWKAMPGEPTWETLIAGRDALMDTDDEIDLSTDQIRECYRAMFAISPTPAASISVAL